MRILPTLLGIIMGLAVGQIAAQGLRSAPLPPPAPAGAPEREEAQAALAAGTNAALIRFLARHPDDASAPAIRDALRSRHHPDAVGAPAEPDAEVVADFDAARLNGSPQAWRAFIQRYPQHPLTAEAARWQ